MDISRADIVMSLSGRDKEQLFYVLELQDEYVLYADGKSRRIEHPKRKKNCLLYTSKKKTVIPLCSWALQMSKNPS